LTVHHRFVLFRNSVCGTMKKNDALGTQTVHLGADRGRWVLGLIAGLTADVCY
jgi:hypothetical protein